METSGATSACRSAQVLITPAQRLSGTAVHHTRPDLRVRPLGGCVSR